MDETFPAPKLDREKLNEVIQFICHRRRPTIGQASLHRVLFMADMLTFQQHGHPLTGAEYQRQPAGPWCKNVNAAVRELTDAGLIETTVVLEHGFTFSEHSSASPGMVSNAEANLLDELLGHVCDAKPSVLAELHPDVAWKGVGVGETIPYFTVHGWQMAEITDDDVAAAIEEARRLRPLMTRQQHAS